MVLPLATEEDGFAVLGIAPTLDAVALKRAYFEALKRSPPHRDAEAFKRLRRAYEELSAPGGLEAAFLFASPATDPTLEALANRWASALASAGEAVREARSRRELATAFVATFSTRTYGEAIETETEGH